MEPEAIASERHNRLNDALVNFKMPVEQAAWMATAYCIGLLIFKGMVIIADAIRERKV